jgi:hypothetical protein
MAHQLTIDKKRCPGVGICKECEMIIPGLVDYCSLNGRVLIGDWAIRENSGTISQLVVACKKRAIMVKPVD